MVVPPSNGGEIPHFGPLYRIVFMVMATVTVIEAEGVT
jgi:hypothetical protein